MPMFSSLHMGSVDASLPCRGSVETLCDDDDMGCVPALSLSHRGTMPRSSLLHGASHTGLLCPHSHHAVPCASLCLGHHHVSSLGG